MIFRLSYTLLITVLSPFFLFGLYKTKAGKPKIGSRWREHWGFTPALSYTSKPIWIHAVSVGETIAAIPIIHKLKAQSPQVEIVLTTTTTTGFEQAKKLGELVTHRYMPLDFPFAIKRFLKVIKPSQLVIMETELWPNTLHYSRLAGVPISLINARLSDKSYCGYAKLKPLIRLVNDCVNQIICQYANDARNFEKLGISPQKLALSGSIKFDITISNDVRKKGKELRIALGDDRPVWIAASTHAGEDEIVLAAHQKVLDVYKDALLILVPRHPERFTQVKMLAQKNHVTIAHSSNKILSGSTQVYLGDTMGEMLEFLEASDVCFMGGSLLGDKVGGHNLLEPAALAKPTLIGPSYFNFQDITDSLIAQDACKVVRNENDLAHCLLTLFNDHSLCSKRGARGHAFVKENTGAVDIIVRHIIQ